MDNYYQLLGIRQDASTEEIEKRCLELGEQLRPDVAGSDRFAQQRFDEVERAYVTLSNPENRAAYDAILITGEEQAGQLSSVADEDGEPWWMRLAWKRYAVIASSLAGLAIVGQLLMASPGMRRPVIDPDIPRPVARANIEWTCSANMSGWVRCSFTNFGTAQGNACVKVHLTIHHGKDSGNRITSNSFCSGQVEPSDVRDRTAQVFFFDGNNQRIDPYKYCTGGTIQDGWPSQCKTTILEAGDI